MNDSMEGADPTFRFVNAQDKQNSPILSIQNDYALLMAISRVKLYNLSLLISRDNGAIRKFKGSNYGKLL